jgi:hypothetical protein
MRYVYFGLDGGDERLYVLERRLDITDPGTGTARADTYILEFRRLPHELEAVLRVSPDLRCR